MNESIKIRKVKINETQYLSKLALNSKAYWGYSEDFILDCQEELQVTEEKINELHYWVAENQDQIVGFYALDPISNSHYELEALFVDPDYIGKGYGKALIIHAKTFAGSLGAEKLFIQGDPNAEKFYLAAGGELTGEFESGSIPGRFLPTFCISLTD